METFVNFVLAAAAGSAVGSAIAWTIFACLWLVVLAGDFLSRRERNQRYLRRD